MEIEPEKFRPQYKVHKILGSGVKTRVGRVSGNSNFLGPRAKVRTKRTIGVPDRGAGGGQSPPLDLGN